MYYLRIFETSCNQADGAVDDLAEREVFYVVHKNVTGGRAEFPVARILAHEREFGEIRETPFAEFHRFEAEENDDVAVFVFFWRRHNFPDEKTAITIDNRRL